MSGVTHNLAYYAQSRPSSLSPHLCDACREVGVLTTSVELLDERPYPMGLPPKPPLALALVAMRETLMAMLDKQGLAFTDVTSARLEFTFPSGYGDGSLYGVRSSLVYRGRTFERFLPIDARIVNSPLKGDSSEARPTPGGSPGRIG